MKKELIKQAIILRETGKSYNEIRSILKVSKSFLSYWLRDVKLSEDQIKNLRDKNPVLNNQFKGVKVAQENRRKQRELWRLQGRELIRNNKNLDLIAGLSLYWAEGYKSNNKNSVALCNTDENLLKYFLNFLRKFFNITNNQIIFKVDCYPNPHLTLDKIQKYWLSLLDLDESCLRKATIIHRKTSGKKKNIHHYGVGSINVNSTKIIQMLYGAIQEFFEFNRPDWD